MPLPSGFVEKYRPDFENVFMFGVCATELSKDELLAVAVFLVNEQRECAEEQRRRVSNVIKTFGRK